MILPNSDKACEVADGNLRLSGNVSYCPDLLKPSLRIPDELCHGDTGVVKSGNSQE